MKDIGSRTLCPSISCALLLASATISAQVLAPQPTPISGWQTVVNNGMVVPGDTRNFNSYNQPSINVDRLVVFRGRSKGGENGEPAHGIFLRDMRYGSPITTLFDRKTPVPQPNNLTAPGADTPVTFTEPPAFPRIDMWSSTVASRGSHMPVWEYEIGTDPDTGLVLTTRVGTSGIYTNSFGPLIAGASNMGMAPDFSFFRVPEVVDSIAKFDVFPGAPAVADASTIVFKGNYSVADPANSSATIGKTGVYYRKLRNSPIGAGLYPAGGNAGVVMIANNSTRIPGTSVPFGSTAPPSAVGNDVVFAGFDNEDAPTLGGIYLAKLNSTNQPAPLQPLIQIGGLVPGEKKGTFFNKIGEGLSFDGRFVAFWGAWGSAVKELVLQCPTDGNRSLLEYCKSLYGDGVTAGSVSKGFHAFVPVQQGIFVHDTVTHSTWAVAKTPNNFADFVYWNFSGKVPPPQGGTSVSGGTDGTITAVMTAAEGSGGEGGTEGDTDGEPARWRSASFVAVSGLVDGKLSNANTHAIFKARTGTVVEGAYANPKDGLYLRPGPDTPVQFTTLVETGMDGTYFDAQAFYIPVDENGDIIGPQTPLPVTSMGIERDGFRGATVVVNIGMANEEAGWAGIYMTQIPK